jgi:hypothetical protein
LTEDLPARRPPEPLETALSVAERQPERAADGQVEDSAGRPPGNRPPGAAIKAVAV